MSTVTSYKFLGPDPGSSSEQFAIRGTGIRAETLALAVRNDGRTPDEAAAEFHVLVEAVLESLDYVDTHAELIARERAEADQELVRRGFMNPDGTWKPISHELITIQSRNAESEGDP